MTMSIALPHDQATRPELILIPTRTLISWLHEPHVRGVLLTFHGLYKINRDNWDVMVRFSVSVCVHSAGIPESDAKRVHGLSVRETRRQRYKLTSTTHYTVRAEW